MRDSRLVAEVYNIILWLDFVFCFRYVKQPSISNSLPGKNVQSRKGKRLDSSRWYTLASVTVSPYCRITGVAIQESYYKQWVQQ